MNEWPAVPFMKLAAPEKSSFSIGPFGSAIRKENYVAKGVPVVRGVNLARGTFCDDEFVYVTEGKADELINANLISGDLVFTHRGTIGQVSMIPRLSRFSRYVLSSSQVKARLDESRAIPEFYYYWFRSPVGRHALLENASTVGVPGIGQPLATIKSINVPNPPLAVQIRIAAVLGVLDDKVAVNDRIITTCEKILRLRFDALEIDVEPVSGDYFPASDFIEFNPRRRASNGEDVVYVDMAALSTVTAQVETWSRRQPKSGTRFMNGDAILARITPCLENGKTAYVDFLKEGEVGVGSTEFIVMRAREKYPSHLSYFLARSRRFRDHAIRNMVGSSGRQRVSAASLADFPLRCPHEGDVAKFGETASTAFGYMRSIGMESKTLKELRDTLLPKLMSGEIRVRDAEKVVEEAT
jgi:type I restriction enzyme S subunit